MPDADPPPELSRPVPLSRLAATGLEFTVTANPDERAAIARRLQVPAVRALELRWVLHRRPGAVVEAEGVLDAVVVQDCVVSLEPFENVVGERFTVRFVPASKVSNDPDDPLDPDAIDEIPYEGERLDLGEAAVEQLALALDPFPRKPGIEPPPGIGRADAAPPEPETSATVHPFAALGKRDRPS